MKKYSVLIIEDEKAALEYLAKAIKKEGFTVLQAQNGKIGLEIFEKERPDIVITDLKMPDIGGMEVLHTVKSLSPHTQVIIITAFGEADTAVIAIREGAIDYIKKPVDLDQMIVALGRAKEKVVKIKRDKAFPTVLIAEDDQQTRIGLSRVVEKEGWNVVSVSNGQEAVDLFKLKKVDIALLDIKMPEKDGIQVLHEMSDITDDFEAIILTAFGDESSAIQAMRDGACNFLKKPIDIEQMLVSIEKAAEQLTLKRALRYRSREVELMKDIMKNITEDIFSPLDLAEKGYECFQKTIDTVPISLTMIDEDMCLKFANHQFTQEFAGLEKIDEKFFQILSLLGLNISQDVFISTFKKILQSETGDIEIIGSDAKHPQILLSAMEIVGEEKNEKFVLMVILVSWAIRKRTMGENAAVSNQ